MKTTQKIKLNKSLIIWVMGILAISYVAPIQAQINTQVYTTNFSTQTTYKPLSHYWSNTRTDNFSTASQKGKNAALTAKYRFVRTDGYVLNTSSNTEGQAVPLYLYYNSTRKDYFTTASPRGIRSAIAAGYNKVGIEGYVLNKVNSKFKHLYKPLWLYYNNARKDNFTIATPKGIKDAEAAGYRKVRIEGYVRINTKAATNQSNPYAGFIRPNAGYFIIETGPFGRLKKEAQKSAVVKSKMEPVKITVDNTKWKKTPKTKIKFVPFKLEDENGKTIPANEKVTLKNGKIITAQQLINKANFLEKKLNAQGYTLRNTNKKIVSKTVTKNEFLDGRLTTAPKAIGPIKRGAELKNFMGLEKKVRVSYLSKNPFFKIRKKTITLKPYSMYSAKEKIEINKYVFSNASETVVAKKISRPWDVIRIKAGQFGNLKKIYEVSKTVNKNWSFGDPSTFQAIMEGTLHRYAKIYPFDPKNPEKSKSEFKVSATGKAKGSLFGNSMDILNASCEFYAPSDLTKKMSAKIQIKALGKTLFNMNKQYAQKATFSRIFANTFDVSFEIEVPIVSGIDFKGLIGAKGEVGFEYGGKILRTVAVVNAYPMVNLQGYAEAGVEFLDLLGGGVGGKLTFIKGELDLQAFTGIWNQNSEQIVLGINYYFGYDLEVLSGSIYAYLEACVKYIGCYRPVEHQLFKWNGYKSSGTIAEGQKTFNLANIAEYESPVMTAED
jgi:hypothetical protein